jgi:2,5-diketo-D-gluconate reductase A
MLELPRASARDDDRSIEIAHGVLLPRLGLGVWEVDPGEAGVQVILGALEAGYRHIDTAQGYENEQAVGEALRRSDLRRDEIFVTTKFFTAKGDPEGQLEQSLERLGTDHVDLYLVHDPRGGPAWAWPAMERVHHRGLARAIGVSNFDEQDLDAVLEIASTPPAVDQIQLSPFAHRARLVEAARERGIAIEAYSPLTRGADLADPRLAAVAERAGRTPAQVMLRWGLQHGFVVLPKSNHRERQAENAELFDFELSGEEMDALDALDRTDGAAVAHENPWW